MLAASSIAKTCLGKVMFIDTGNSFSAKRIVEFVEQDSDHAHSAVNVLFNSLADNFSISCSFSILFYVFYFSLQARKMMDYPKNLIKYLILHNAKCYFEQGNKVLPQILDNIICCSVFDIFKLLDVLHDLLNNLKYQVLS